MDWRSACFFLLGASREACEGCGVCGEGMVSLRVVTWLVYPTAVLKSRFVELVFVEVLVLVWDSAGKLISTG